MHNMLDGLIRVCIHFFDVIESYIPTMIEIMVYRTVLGMVLVGYFWW